MPKKYANCSAVADAHEDRITTTCAAFASLKSGLSEGIAKNRLARTLIGQLRVVASERDLLQDHDLAVGASRAHEVINYKRSRRGGAAMSNPSSFRGQPITLQLLDSASGRIVQVWQLPPRPTITIGRASEQDVSIADPYVSRQHAELRFRDNAWSLAALGLNGVLVNGREVVQTPIADGTAFRLGGNGPILKFYSSILPEGELTTLSGKHAISELLPQLNTAKRDEEVREIVESGYFQKLREHAREMRKRRDTDAEGN